MAKIVGVSTVKRRELTFRAIELGNSTRRQIAEYVLARIQKMEAKGTLPEEADENFLKAIDRDLDVLLEDNRIRKIDGSQREEQLRINPEAPEGSPVFAVQGMTGAKDFQRLGGHFEAAAIDDWKIYFKKGKQLNYFSVECLSGFPWFKLENVNRQTNSQIVVGRSSAEEPTTISEIIKIARFQFSVDCLDAHTTTRLQLPCPLVSSFQSNRPGHAIIQVHRQGGGSVIDLQSTNGTFVATSAEKVLDQFGALLAKTPDMRKYSWATEQAGLSRTDDGLWIRLEPLRPYTFRRVTVVQLANLVLRVDVP